MKEMRNWRRIVLNAFGANERIKFHYHIDNLSRTQQLMCQNTKTIQSSLPAPMITKIMVEDVLLKFDRNVQHKRPLYNYRIV